MGVNYYGRSIVGGRHTSFAFGASEQTQWNGFLIMLGAAPLHWCPGAILFTAGI